MIYIVEIPHQRPASAWTGDRDHIISVANSMAQRSGEAVYEQTTPREMLAQFGYASVEDARADEDTSTADTIQALIDRFGADTTIYKGFGETEDWQAEPVDDLACALNYIGHDLNSLKVFSSEEEALEALNDGTFDCHQGGRARGALLEKLKLELSRKFGTTEIEGDEYTLTDQADFTNRLLPGGYTNYNDAADGEEYDFEMSASAIDRLGNPVKVYWLFEDTKGEDGRELDSYDYSEASRVEVL